jgi:hypothetical protein
MEEERVDPTGSPTTPLPRSATFAPAELARFATDVLGAHGVPAADAALLADTLVTAELWGHASHGLLRLPWYVARLRSGAMAAVTQPEVVRDGVNGLVCEPDPAAVGASLAALGAKPGYAAALGEAGYDSTRAISWDGVVAALTAGPARREEPPVA